MLLGNRKVYVGTTPDDEARAAALELVAAGTVEPVPIEAERLTTCVEVKVATGTLELVAVA